MITMGNAIAVFATMKTVRRAIDVLMCFSHEEPELSIGDISRRLGIHKSVVSRLVTTLCAKRMLQKDLKTRRVSIGVGAFTLGALFIKRVPLEQYAAAHLSRLVETVEHSCHVAVLDGHRLLTIASAETRKALRVILRTGEYRYLHATAGGKLLLALHPGLLEAVADSTGFPAITTKTITSLARLRKELAGIRDAGFAWNFEESTRGAGACAAPIFDASGQVAGVITAVYPLSAVSKTDFAAISDKTREAGRLISASMGWQPDLRRNGASSIAAAHVVPSTRSRTHQRVEA